MSGTYDQHDIQGYLKYVVQEAINHCSGSCSEMLPDPVLSVEYHKLDLAEIDLRIFHAKHCSATRAAICVKSNGARVFKVYVGMGVRYDRPDVYGAVYITSNFYLLGSFLKILGAHFPNGVHWELMCIDELSPECKKPAAAVVSEIYEAVSPSVHVIATMLAPAFQ